MPPSNRSCAGSPYGDNWETWKADFFEPARALLGAAPWVFVRGNHESCDRAGGGWSRLMSAFPFDDATGCKQQERPFTVDLGEFALAVLDVTGAEDRVVNPMIAGLFREQFAGLGKTQQPLLVAMHKPVYGSARVKEGISEGDTKTLVDAAHGALPPNLRAFISGHLHTFQALGFVEDFPAQIIAGTGGDPLDAFAPQTLDGLTINNVKVDKGRSVTDVFGFALLERAEGAWSLTHMDSHGNPRLHCLLVGRKISCE